MKKRMSALFPAKGKKSPTASTSKKRVVSSPSPRKSEKSPPPRRMIKSPSRSYSSPRKPTKTTNTKIKSPVAKKAAVKVSPRYAFRPPPIPPPPSFSVKSPTLERRINSSSVVIFGRAGCGWCQKAKEMFEGMGASYLFVDIVDPSTNFTREEMVRLNEITSPTDTVPRIFINGKFAGGFSETSEKIKNGTVKI
jgi:glutaredoxin 1